MCAVPYVAIVDAGTVELVRSLGVEVVTSAELIQIFEARWTPEALEIASGSGPARGQGSRRGLRTDPRAHAQRRAAAGSRGEGFRPRGFRRRGPADRQRTDCGLQRQRLAIRITSRAPSVTSPIQSGDWVLLDMWAKLDQPGAVYYDITWTAFCGDHPTDEMRARLHHGAATRAMPPSHACRARSAEGETLRGFEVDDACRAVIIKAGYGEFFTHRTGHSIGVEVHGNGANMDNFETHDERRVMPWSCFSVEPGIYLPNFGVRARDQHVHRRQRRAGDRRDPARNGPAVMPPQALAAVATLLAVLPHGNRIELQLDRGSAELIWITPSTFHFRRVLNGPLRPSAEEPHEPVAVTTDDTGGAAATALAPDRGHDREAGR